MDKECFFFGILKHLTLFDGDILATTVWCAHNRTTGTILYYIRYHKFKSDGVILATSVWCAHNRTGTILYYIRYHAFKS